MDALPYTDMIEADEIDLLFLTQYVHVIVQAIHIVYVFHKLGIKILIDHIPVFPPG